MSRGVSGGRRGDRKSETIPPQKHDRSELLDTFKRTGSDDALADIYRALKQGPN